MLAVTDFELPPKARTISLRRTSAAAFDAAAVGRLDDASGQHKAIWPWWRSKASRTGSKDAVRTRIPVPLMILLTPGPRRTILR